MENEKVSIIFGTVDRNSSVKRLIESIELYTPPIEYEVIIVDSGKNQSNFEYVSKKQNVIFFYDPAREGFVKAYNKGAMLATGKYIVWLNDDCKVTEGWLSKTLAFMRGNSDVGIAGIPFIDFKGTPKENGPIKQTIFGMYVANFGCVKRTIWEALDGFDEAFHSYGGETDFCCKVINMGLKILPVPGVCIDHYRVQDEHRMNVMNKYNKGAHSVLKAKWGNNIHIRGLR